MVQTIAFPVAMVLHTIHTISHRHSWYTTQVQWPWINPNPDSLRVIHPEELMSSLVNALSGRVGGGWKGKIDLLDMLCSIERIIIGSIIS